MNKYYFSTRDLLLIAILGCLGGVLSAYAGYVGSTLGSLTGIPFSGQLISGIHVLWIVLIMGMVGKKGSGTLAGLIKGFVEFVSGSHLGIFVVLLSVAEGVFAEAGFWPLRRYRTLSYLVAGGLGSLANVLLQQLLWDKFGALPLLALVSVFAVASGIVFGGCLALGIANTLYGASVIRKPESARPAKVNIPAMAVVVIVCVVAVFLALHFYQPASASEETAASAGDAIPIAVSGSVDRAQSYDLRSFQDRFVKISALNNDKSGGNRDYTGLPLKLLLESAGVQAGAARIDITASDGYMKTFLLSDIMPHDDIILADNDRDCLLVIPGQDLQMWVKHVDRIRVY
jgi:energy-coupling factor transport system substrate-specific component